MDGIMSYHLIANFFNDLIISAKSAFCFTSYEKKFNGALTIENSLTLNLSDYDFLKTDTITENNTLHLNFNSKVRIRGEINPNENSQLQILGVDASDKILIQNISIQQGANQLDFTSELFSSDSHPFSIQFKIIGTGAISFKDLFVYTIIDENEFGDIIDANFIDFKVKASDVIPQLSQKELFKHALVSIAGFFSTDNYRKIIKIHSLSELNKLNSLDFSDKFIIGSENVSNLTDYAQINYFTYQNSADKNDKLGSGMFTINAETLPKVAYIYNSIFEASSETEINYKNYIDNSIYSDAARICEINTLLAYLEYRTDYTIARFNKLDANSLLSAFYDNFLNAIKKGVILEAEFDLTKTDFFTFDFTKQIYISQLKSTFYVLRIQDYSEHNLTKLILLKSH